MRPRLNVFFAIGKYFIQYFTVALTSLLETNRDLDLNIFLIYDFQEVSLLDETIKFIQKHYGISINLLYQDSSLFENYRVSKHVSINTYLRLLLTDIIPENIDSGLFLDADIVVTGSLKELADFNFAGLNNNSALETDKFLCAVSEIEEQRIANSERLTKLGYQTNSYFNAGIMLVNLKNWRLIKASEHLMEIAEKHMDDLVYWDQDILNMYFVNKWHEIDKKFNALHLIWKRKRTPLIVHYAGSSKPWNYLDRHPYKSWYFKFLKLTPYDGKKYVDYKFNKAPYKYYRDIRHFLNYFRQLILGKAENK